LECTITIVQEIQKGLKFSGTHQLLSFADDINTVGENIDTIKKNTYALVVASEEVGLEANPKETKYVLMSYYQVV
jgi:hypothetical protein